MKTFNNQSDLIKEYNKHIKRKYLGIEPDASSIGNRILVNGIGRRPILSNRWTSLKDKDGYIIAQYRKCVGLGLLK